MSYEGSKAVVRRVTEAENTKNYEVLEELIAPIYLHKTLKLEGPEGYRQFLKILFKAFPDWHETIEEMIAEGDKVCVRLVIDTGAQTGEMNFMGATVPPTGNRSTVRSIQIWRIEDGKVVEQESVYDELDLYKQLGLIEPTERGRVLFAADRS